MAFSIGVACVALGNSVILRPPNGHKSGVNPVMKTPDDLAELNRASRVKRDNAEKSLKEGGHDAFLHVRCPAGG